MAEPGTADRALAALLRALCAEHDVPGAQLTVRRPGRTTTVVTGVERASSARPVTPASTFPIGSLTKPLTAALVVLLAGEDEFSLDDEIGEHLPEFASGAPAPGVTIRRLLSHTAGLAANVEAEAGPSAGPAARRRWVRQHTGAAPFPPGLAFSYANPGYVVLGALVETVTGLSWWESLESIVLRPWGITEADPWSPTVSGHRAGKVEVDDDVPPLEAPAGGCALSAPDLVRVADMFLPDRPDRPGPAEALAAHMCTDETRSLAFGPTGLAAGWGLGWARYTEPAAWGHDGTGDGSSCHLRFDPATGTAVALTTNSPGGPAVWDGLAERLAGAGLPAGPLPARGINRPARVLSDPAGSAPWIGTYRNGEAELTVEPGPGGLQLALGRRPWARLTVYTDLRLVAEDDSGGRQTGAFVQLPGPDGTPSLPALQISGRLAGRC